MSTPALVIDPSVARYNVALAELYKSYPGKRLVVGVAIFSPTKRLLLLKRAASEDMFPNMYEIPGGHAEDDDETILSTVVRETHEETGLTVRQILGEFEGFEYEAGKGPTVQLNFRVEVEGNDQDPSDRVPVVTMRPDEHQAFAWIKKGEDLGRYELTGAMHKVVLDALKSVEQ